MHTKPCERMQPIPIQSNPESAEYLIRIPRLPSRRQIFGILLLCSAVLLGIDKSILSVSYDNSATEKKQATKKASPPPPANIAINRNSKYVRSDVSKIVHVPSEARIEIHLQPNNTRRCQSPVFKGRISGWSLSMIKFENVSSDVVEGQYDLNHMPLSGRYHVEILVVMCERIEETVLRTMNLRDVCTESMEDDSHQITEGDGNATIDIILPDKSPKRHDANFRGRWVHKSLLSKDHHRNSTNSTQQDPKPLFTPFQPGWCMAKQHRDNEYCANVGPVRKELFEEYIFHWNSGPDMVLNQPGLGKLLVNDVVKSNRSEVRTNVCFLGASHSRTLKNSCASILNQTRNEAKRQKLKAPLLNRFGCSKVEVAFPWEVNKKIVRRIGSIECTHVVVGLFQWFFSFKRKNSENITFSDWKIEISNVVQLFQNASRESKVPSLRRVLLRSAHPNGFNSATTQCRAKDYRTTLNAEFGTKILKEIADEFAPENGTANSNEMSLQPLSFLDTSFIMDAVWDSARDWSHYEGEIRDTETRFILAEILNGDELLFQGDGSII